MQPFKAENCHWCSHVKFLKQFLAMKRKHIFILFMLLPAFSGICQEKYTLSGVIIDSESGKTLNGIDIVVEDQNTGTITNQKGSFLLHLDEGKHNITISGKGYNNKELTIDLNDNIVKEVNLTPDKANEKKPSKRREKKSQNHTTLLSLL